jgi:hypothetical protein
MGMQKLYGDLLLVTVEAPFLFEVSFSDSPFRRPGLGLGGFQLGWGSW